MKLRRPRQGILPLVFEQGVREDVTGRAGLTLVAEAIMACGTQKAVEKHLCVREREAGYSESEKVSAMILLQAAGGECVQDIRILSADLGLERMLGRKLPSPDALRDFLADFHDAKLFEDRPEEGAFIPEESEALRAFAAVNTDVVKASGKGHKATIDLDATIVESHKREAFFHYKGGRGYQPTLAVWAEEDLVLADEFRDGNVPAGMKPLRVAKRAFSALPAHVRELFFRGDSACYEEHLLKWLSAPLREDGPRGEIGFSISADMTEQLRSVCKAETSWALLEIRDREIVEWAEVEFVPGDWPKEARPLRYVALRFTEKQGELFGESRIKYLAVVTNRWELAAPELIRWHWEKAGTVELVHDVMKNELGAGTMPSKLFGSNAAWYRLSGLTYNVLSFLKKQALPERLWRARPKRLRFELFTMPAKLTEPGGVLTVKANAPKDLTEEMIAARGKLLDAYERLEEAHA